MMTLSRSSKARQRYEPPRHGSWGRNAGRRVSGNVFAASDGLRTRMHEVNESKKGVLHLINNTLATSAWDMARELAEAEDIKIGVVLINDDVAVMNSAIRRRRGVAGNFLVSRHAERARGASLEDLVKLGEKVVSVVARWAWRFGLRPRERQTDLRVGDGEMEMGVGIHSEKGRARQTASADA